MGNVPTVAQVMRPDGIVVEYNYPIQVAMLMTLHPDYLVIQSPIAYVAPGERRNVKVMDVEDRLALGKSYLMYPIPVQYKEIFNESPPQAEGKSKASRLQALKLTLAAKLHPQRKSTDEEKRKRSWWRLKVIAKEFPDSFALTSGDLGMQKEQPDLKVKRSTNGFQQKEPSFVKLPSVKGLQPVAEIREFPRMEQSQ